MDTRESWRLPDDITFEQWVAYVFDHPVVDPSWWWQEPESGYLQAWDDRADPARTLAFVTRLFERPEVLIGRFTRGQIDQGLGFLVSDSCSGHMSAFGDVRIPWAQRRKGIDAMITLYANLMAPVYGNDLGHTEVEPCGPEGATFGCYMLWDVSALGCCSAGEDSDRINDAVLHVAEEVLKFRAESCLESVLHGLGHWYFCVPERTEPIVREFLRRTDISPELRRYAEAAAIGCVQ